MSGDLKWCPVGNQRATHGELGPVHHDILLTKLRPGQEVNIEMHCVKGIGKEHAKWSPVGTVSYRLLPEIILLRDYTGEQAHQLQRCFGEGVIQVETGKDGVEKAVVANERAYNMNREVHRHPHLADGVRLQRVRDHFIFSVESTGALPAVELVKYAMEVLSEKVKYVQQELTAHQEGDEEQMDAEADDAE
jgi:DNA-directed RNA polymerase I and III subunit RPAC1